MQTKPGFPNRMRLLSLCLLVILAISCGSKDKFIGIYKAEAKDSRRQAETIMELKPNGDGVWRVNDEEVPFAWYIKGGELRINTRGGGVIVGAIEKDAIHVTLAGTKAMSFKKIQ